MTMQASPDYDDPIEIERLNNRKLTADKIRATLMEVVNNPSQSAKRWVWELVQNAKDVPSAFGRISIKIILSRDGLSFRHNGDAFNLHQVFSLIQQVSSKNSTNSDEEITGKFGTGFISTHLLSELIHVDGYVHHKNLYRKLKLVLDRSGNSSEELLPKIEEALEYARQIENNDLFPVSENYEANRIENSHDTGFYYPLDTPERLKAAQDGIKDLVNTLPFTLINLSKIGRVHVIDNIANEESLYTLNHIESLHNYIRKYQVDISAKENKVMSFLTYADGELNLTAQVDSFENLKLLPLAKGAPRLYRDFPLIGTEKFFFPFVLNGVRFNPTEKRDGIHLHGLQASNAIENRKILDSAYKLAQQFTSYLVEEQAKDLYLCALSRLPDEKWEKHSKTWFSGLQSGYRAFLLSEPVIETESGERMALGSCKIPNYGADQATKLKFHKLAASLVGRQHLPAGELLLNWIEFSGPRDELESWNYDIYYELEDFLKSLQGLGSLSTLVEEFESDEACLNWLNEFYIFLIDQKQSEFFTEYCLVPNQYGHFKSLNDLFTEVAGNEIPDDFLDVLKSLDVDWRSELIYRGARPEDLIINKRTLNDASKVINDILRQEEKNSHGVLESTFLKRPDSFEILVEILRNTTASGSQESFRSKVFSKAKDLFKFEEGFRQVSTITDFSFTTALRHLIRLIHDKIQDIGTIENMSSLLGMSTDSTIAWLNEYYQILKVKEDFSNELEYGNIIPNRKGVFSAKDTLYNYGTEEVPLDDLLLSILKEFKPTEDWFDLLLLDGLDLKLEPKKFDELGTSIDQIIKDLETSEIQTPGSIIGSKEPILNLINWCNKHEKLAQDYLKYTILRKNDLWVKLSMTEENMAVVKDSDAMDLAIEVSKAKLSTEQINELKEITRNYASMTDKSKRKLAERIEDILEEERDFQVKLEIGKRVEELLYDLLIDAIPDLKVQYIGVGKFDFVLQNPKNNQRYYIELKSLAANNQQPVKMSIAQAKYAASLPERYALCVIKKPSNNTPMDIDYIKANMKCAYSIGNKVRATVEKANEVDKYINDESSIALNIKDPEMKVYLNQNYILPLGETFTSLKERITTQLL